MLYIFLSLIIAMPQDAALANKANVPQFGLTMTFPEGWQVKTEDVEPMLVVAQNDTERALTLIGVNPVTMKTDDETYLDSYLALMKKNFENLEIISRGETKIAGLDALEAIYIGSRGSVKIQYHVYSFHKYGDQFLVTFAVSPEKFDKLKLQFQSIATSLEIEGNPHSQKTVQFLAETKKRNPDYDLMAKLLEDGANIDGVGQDKTGALFAAVKGRNGKLVKWLISNEIDLQNPRQDMVMISMLGTPAIRTLLKQAVQKDAGPEPVKKSGGQMPEIQWVSDEAQLFAGIHNADLDDVKAALAKGADTNAKDNFYKLTPLPLIHRIIAEFEEVELDASTYHPIRDYLQKELGGGPRP